MSPDEPREPKYKVPLDRPQGTVVGDFANVVNNFFGDPRQRFLILVIIAVLVLILCSIWALPALLRPAVPQPSESPIPSTTSQPTSTSLPSVTLEPSATRTPIPIYRGGLITYITSGENSTSVYRLGTDGNPVPSRSRPFRND